LIARDLEMACDIIENRSKRSNAKSMMARNRDVMFPFSVKRQPHVTSRLAGHGVSDAAEAPREVVAREIAWQSQTAITSSRVK
jgi:hypothetical protein